jgi:erythronate-4-phosphate dehydrogenase
LGRGACIILTFLESEMILVVDDAIPYYEEAFASVGELRTFRSGNLRRGDMLDADALIVRSTTRVDQALLDGTPIRFVGTASIGMDHLDQEYLESQDIHCANAAGSNAKAVAEYVVAALLVIVEELERNLSELSLAIIGVGNVGSRVAAMANALGLEVLLCDPPLREKTDDRRYLALDDMLGADILTFHVPLTLTGPHSTYHMADETLFGRLTPRQFIINTARGAVIDSRALKSALAASAVAGAVLDVWEDEPRIDYSLLELADLGTPHIAGSSLDGKLAGTRMVLEALCSYHHLRVTWDGHAKYPGPRTIRVENGARDQRALQSAVLQAYDIRQDDARLRGIAFLGTERSAEAFDSIRSDYPLRPEFHHFVVELEPENIGLGPVLEALGFRVAASVSPRRGD